ncbi:MAG: dephospho-CoA kinase [Bdellovibrionota bacterium]
MQVWAITGLWGTGKTTAVEYLQSKGYPSVNIEELSRRMVNKDTEEGREGFSKIFKVFGNEILNAQGGLDRTKLLKRIMANPHEKKNLEGALDPLVVIAIDKLRVRWKDSGTPFAFIEGSRIFEGGFDKGLRGVIAVNVEVEKRVKRLMKRDTLGVDEVRLMIQMQDTDIIRRLASVAFDNNGKVESLHKQIDQFIKDKALTK